jgi:hypothetical protein
MPGRGLDKPIPRASSAIRHNVGTVPKNVAQRFVGARRRISLKEEEGLTKLRAGKQRLFIDIGANAYPAASRRAGANQAAQRFDRFSS